MAPAAIRAIELYCTYFDHNYLRKGLALYLSLRRQSRPQRAVLVVLALSERCEQILQRLALPHLLRDVDSEGQQPAVGQPLFADAAPVPVGRLLQQRMPRLGEVVQTLAQPGLLMSGRLRRQPRSQRLRQKIFAAQPRDEQLGDRRVQCAKVPVAEHQPPCAS